MTHKANSNQVIYKLTNRVTGEFYVGLTVAAFGKDFLRAARARFNRHVCRARRENKQWALCLSIRKYGRPSFEVSVIDVIRTKQVAHQVEIAYINSLQPQLNSTNN